MSLAQAAKFQAKAEIEELENLLHLSESLGAERSPGSEYVKESKRILSKANDQLGNLNVGWKPWKLMRIGFAADTISTYLSAVRYNLVYVLPREKLPLLVANAHRELCYIPGSELETEREKLNSVLQSIEDSADGVETRLRNTLASVVANISGYKKEVSHRSSVRRSRLVAMLFVLGIILLLCYILVPFSITDWSSADGPDGPTTGKHTGIAVPWRHVFFIVVAVEFLGALGGALSSMQSRSEETRPLHDLYVQETLMYLRPAVGASAALGLTLMQIAGVVELFPHRGSDFGINAPVLLSAAFLAGFSERFFVQMATLIDREPSEKKDSKNREDREKH
jgi:hypothetical protein